MNGSSQNWSLHTPLQLDLILTQSVEDLNRAILARAELNSSIQLEKGHSNQIHLYLDLEKRFNLTGLLEDSDKAIDKLQEIVTLDVGPDKQAMCLTMLSNTLQGRFLKTGLVEELFRAIEAGRRATQVEGDVGGNERQAFHLSVLGNALHLSWDWTSSKDDLIGSVIAYETALDLSSKGSEDHLTYQTNLARFLQVRFVKDRQLRDLKRAINLSRNAVDLTPVENEHRTFRLFRLAQVSHTKYEATGSLKDLEDAIESNKLAIECASEGNEYRDSAYAESSQLLQLKFAILGSMEDIRFDRVSRSSGNLRSACQSNNGS